jgi:NodT family efflux transporter outer membrane factor (OMF) lipoprotein
MKNNSLILLFLVLCLFGACKSLNTNMSVSKKELPKTFAQASDSSNTSAINWRNYFADDVLTQLIDTALRNNQDVQLALQRIEMARANVRMSKGALLPQVGLGVGGGLRKFGRYTMDGAGNITTDITPGKIVPIDLPDMYLGVQASWEVDIWGKLRNQRKAAMANYLSTFEGVHYVTSNLVAEIAIAYYELLDLDNELEIVSQTIVKQEAALEIVKAQKESGRANELAVQQFTSMTLHSKVLEKELLQKIVVVENRINFLLGRFPQAITRQKDILMEEPTQQFGAGVPSQLLQNRPDIREAELQVQATKFDLKAAKAAFYPNLTITAGLGFQAFDPAYLFMSPASLAYSALGNLVTPLVNRNALHARFQYAKAQQISAMHQYQKTILNGYVDVANELSNIQKMQEIRTLVKQQKEILMLAVETSNELYKSGRASYLEVLMAQQHSLQTQLDLINSNKRQRIAYVNLYRALGGGWR